MKNKQLITSLVILIVIISAVASLVGIFSSSGAGQRTIESVRGQIVTLYGQGLYKDMSADVAIQGVAQDWVTLFLGIPMLLVGLYFARNGSLRGRLVLSGAIGYFLVTYLFYMTMAMYNQMFLAYIGLLGLSFFALAFSLFSFDLEQLRKSITNEKLFKYVGYFLMSNSILIAMLWLSIILPAFIKGVVPNQVEHYTTLIVQGFDLGLLLPICFVSGWLAVRKNIYGYLYVIVNLILLVILMTALVSKIVFMANAGQNVIPVVFIIPVIDLLAIIFSFLLIRNISDPTQK
jgi:hypothetical protein